jgi:hypothetical protein
MVNELISYIPIIIATFALVLSFVNILYTWLVNKRRLEVNLKFNDSTFRFTEELSDIKLELSAFNSGYYTVAIINYEFHVNNRIIEFNTVSDENSDSSPVYTLIQPEGPKLPYILKEGEMTVTKIDAMDLAKVLRYEKLKGKVELSGHYETAQHKIYHSKPISFNIDDWKYY